MICASILNREQLKELDQEKIDLVELRFDLINDSPGNVIPLFNDDQKIIATCRPGKHSDIDRLEILSEAIRSGAKYIDIEVDSDKHFTRTLRDIAEQFNCEVIISWHDFNATPDRSEMIAILEKCYEQGGDIAKLATMVNSKQDMIRLMSLYDHPGRKVIIGMGELAGITRVAAPILGSEFTFASTSAEEETAPGQLTVDELLTVYKILKYS